MREREGQFNLETAALRAAPLPKRKLNEAIKEREREVILCDEFPCVTNLWRGLMIATFYYMCLFFTQVGQKETHAAR